MHCFILKFRPRESFSAKDLPESTITHMYKYYNARRLDLIRTVLKVREEVYQEAEKSHAVLNSGLHGSPARHLLSTGSLSNITGSMSALNSVISSQPFELAREKFGRSMHLEKQWLIAALKAELANVRELEKADSFHSEKNNQELIDMRKKSDKKRMNDAQKRKEADRRAADQEEARRRDCEDAKENFCKRQDEIRLKEEQAREAAREKFMRQLELEKERALRQEMQEMKRLETENEMKRTQEVREEADRLRKTDMEKRKSEYMDSIHQKGLAKQKKINDALKRDARMRYEKLQRYQEKEARDQELKEQQRHENLKKAMEKAKEQHMKELARQKAYEEAKQLEHEKKNRALLRREESEMKLERNREEKARQMAARREAEYLREACRDFNLERMKRRDEFKRDSIGEHTAMKMARSKILEEERRLMTLERKRALDGSYRARELAREMIHDMKIKSKFNSHKIESLIHSLTKEKELTSLFKPYDPATRILASVASANRPGKFSPLPARSIIVGGSPMPVDEAKTNGEQKQGVVGGVDSPDARYSKIGGGRNAASTPNLTKIATH